MVSNPSSSTPVEAELDAASLARLTGDEETPLCLLDCRQDGTPMKKATRVRIPHMLLRRIQSGSMAITNVCPALQENNVRVVVVPESPGADDQMSRTLKNVLKQNGFTYNVFNGDTEEAVVEYPVLRATDVQEPMVLGQSEDPSWLNLRSLNIHEGGEPRRLEKHKQVFPVQINSHLFLGNAETAGNRPFLQELGITHIVNVTSNLPNAFEDDPAFHYLRISVDDNCSHNLFQFFPEAIRFIEGAAASGGKCLVHCLAGISRSVTVCIAYLMSTHRWPLEEAYDQVLRCNGSIAPNFHFMGQLHDFERQLGLASSQVPSTSRVPPISAPPLVSHSGAPPLSPSCGAQAAAHQVGTPTTQHTPFF